MVANSETVPALCSFPLKQSMVGKCCNDLSFLRERFGHLSRDFWMVGVLARPILVEKSTSQDGTLDPFGPQAEAHRILWEAS